MWLWASAMVVARFLRVSSATNKAHHDVDMLFFDFYFYKSFASVFRIATFWFRLLGLCRFVFRYSVVDWPFYGFVFMFFLLHRGDREILCVCVSFMAVPFPGGRRW